jgi:hypothetical protein
VNRLWTIPAALVLAAIVVLAPAAAPDRKPPRIVAAAMLDTNGNFRADRVRLIYSERIRHAADRDGHYPLVVSGYRIRWIGAAGGRTLLVFLVEKRTPDGKAQPAIWYHRTTSKPIRDWSGNQAVPQGFRLVRAHGHAPPAAPVSSPAPLPAPSPTPSPSPTASDSDHDGTPDAQDCAPRDASVHPGAPDLPDLSFVDSNCDGIDGTEADAIFVSPSGNDANPGTKVRPKREIQAAIAAVAAGNGRYVLVAVGEYQHLDLEKNSSGSGIYGGYDPKTWSRSASLPDASFIAGAPEAILAVQATGIVLQLLTVSGRPQDVLGASAYGIRAVDGSELTLQRVNVAATFAEKGGRGESGGPGASGGAGADGTPGACDDTDTFPAGGPGGPSPAGRTGGRGGWGGDPAYETGGTGETGQPATPGGAGGKNGNVGFPGTSGQPGGPGRPGAAGFGGGATTAFAGAFWIGQAGGIGIPGQPGNGGGGGGGGGAQAGVFVVDGYGNGGGGGGGGGAGGGAGQGGGPGGGSFGVYLYNSSIVVESSAITADDGGYGGDGGSGGLGGTGGAGGKGGTTCTSEVGSGGAGGRGGDGGQGGRGGGGAGGPSVGIFKAGASSAKVKDSKIQHGTPGVGGDGDSSFTGSYGQPGIAADIYPSS